MACGGHLGGPLDALFAEVSARAATPVADLTDDHTRAAMDAYVALAGAGEGEMEPVARAAMAPLVPRVLGDAAWIRGLMRDDPASPGLETAYLFLLSELSTLATVFVSVGAEPRLVPNPLDEYADEYLRVCAEIRALTAASESAIPAWRLIRNSRCAARARPPRRPKPSSPLADDTEYYL